MPRFLLGATLALTTMAAGLPPAAVAQTSVNTWCWAGKANQNLKSYRCSVSKRINYNGHRVIDVVDEHNLRYSVVFWQEHKNSTSGQAEWFYDGKRVNANWYTDSQGDVRISFERGGQLAIRFPGSRQPSRAVAAPRGSLIDALDRLN